MSLLEVRKNFIQTCGRYDLVVDTTDWVDQGANFFIDAGQKWLDSRANIDKSHSRVFETINAGDWYVLFQKARAIQQVWVSNATGEKWQLCKVDFDIIRAAYADIPTDLDQGDPLYYTPIYVRTTPETAGKITITYFGAIEFADLTKDHYTYNGLVFMPPVEATMTLEIHGLFYSPTLAVDTDENYWTEVNPLVLVMAACRAVEATYRNSTGVRDWENAIDSELFGMDKDTVEQEIAEADQMEG